MPHFLSSSLRKVGHFVYHDVLPVVAGAGALAGCLALTSPADLGGCIALGVGVYGYVNNAINTGKGISKDDGRAFVDDAAFVYCLGAEAVACGAVAGAATLADYTDDVDQDGTWGGDAAKKAERGVGFDIAGVGLGHTLDGLAEDTAKAEEASANAAEHRGPAGGGSAPTTENAPGGGAAGVVKGLSYAVNYEYATVTCANPFDLHGRCAE